MMISEFIERTGFEPTCEEYRAIEEAYYEYDGNKDQFCRAFLENNGRETLDKARVAKIADLEQKLATAEEQQRAMKQLHKKECAQLQAALDKELEWRPCDGGTTLDQECYEELAACTSTRALTEEQAKQRIYQKFGFAQDRIAIIQEVFTYEANKYGIMRPATTYTRQPLYNATDWNYIRFDCCGWQYEMVNGALQNYCD